MSEKYQHEFALSMREFLGDLNPENELQPLCYMDLHFTDVCRL
jgi:hypothetical protein